VFMSCGHGGICYECAQESWKKADKCVICRHPIEKIVKIKEIKGIEVSRVVEVTKKVKSST